MRLVSGLDGVGSARSTAVREVADSATDSPPAALRRATEFIDEYVQLDISINDIADAVGMSPRSVQTLFRREYGYTPLEYIRRVRLERAHLDLIASDSTTSTVGQIARHWGFKHFGRFSIQYREAYGQSPSTTLGEDPHAGREVPLGNGGRPVSPNSPSTIYDRINFSLHLDNSIATYLQNVDQASLELNSAVDASPEAVVRLALKLLAAELSPAEVIAELQLSAAGRSNGVRRCGCLPSAANNG